MNKFFVAFLFLLISCQNSSPQNVNAVAVIQPGNGYNARGNVLFEQDGAEVIIKVNISGLNSNSYHGFHIHEFGDIRSQDGKSAGFTVYFRVLSWFYHSQCGIHLSGRILRKFLCFFGIVFVGLWPVL